MSPRSRTFRLAAAICALAGAVLALLATPAGATSPDIVLSQVYGGGGNTGAPYRNDFIELYNRGASSVSLSGWTVQYASAGGSSWSTTALTGTMAPGTHYLVKEGSGGSNGALLPTPDATGSINMSATAGKVALRTNTTPLTCSTGCATQSGVKDFVGYGSSASSYETAPTGNLSNTNAALRLNNGATDTDNNSADLSIGAPTPRNSSGGGGGTRIRTIQGTAHLSPSSGQQVTAVPGVVTAKARTASTCRTRSRTPTPPPARGSTSTGAPHPASRSATRSR